MRGPKKFRRDRDRAKTASAAHKALAPMKPEDRHILLRDAMRANHRLIDQKHSTLKLHRTVHRPRRRPVGVVGY